MTEKKKGLNPIAAGEIGGKIDESLKNISNNKGKLPELSSVMKAADKIYKEITSLKEAEKNSFIDSATACYNRNFWENFANNEFNPNRDEKPTLIVCDINNLKEVNDNQGHEAGNEIIKTTANVLKEKFRRGDKIVRYGGDEFIIICYNAGKIENFREEVSEKLSPLEQKENQINIAFGIAQFNPEIDKKEKGFLLNTFKRADELMYDHKNQR